MSVRGILYSVGMMVRETGQALDRAGCRLQGKYAFREQLSRHRPVMNLMDKVPRLVGSVFVAPSASVIGDVEIGAESSVWYGTVLRGDVNAISIGERTNIQDRAVVHVSQHGLSAPAPTVIGSRVTIGHGAIIHAATIEDEALVGMGSVLLDGCVVRRHSLIAAGSLVSPGTEIPSGELWAGSPAKMMRKLTDDEIQGIINSAVKYAELAPIHAAENSKSWQEIEGEKLRRKLMERRSEDYSSHIGTLGKEREITETQARLAEAER
uniref:Gamma carbonic anhydrase n=1 Tax=Compsopogon caeruleus TaxID=31354 RepID=A0A7S1XG36_9RHOD|mmetsp:Transcript_5105/g.10351  ORF Transcript_5105/g.10351 Transcript_5105/m.10351 type:complete len:266 (-) Transcript_5105:46-843(-)